MDEARDNLLDHYQFPRNQGALAAATIVQRADNPLCGDRVTLHLVIADDSIQAVGFEGRGCTISQAAASMLTEAIIGKTCEQARQLDEAWMLALVGAPLNPARRRCATLGLAALHEGLASGSES